MAGGAPGLDTANDIGGGLMFGVDMVGLHVRCARCDTKFVSLKVPEVMIWAVKLAVAYNPRPLMTNACSNEGGHYLEVVKVAQ